MLIDMKTHEGATTLALHGRFVFNAHRAFRSVAGQAIDAPTETIDIDLSGVEYLDSAGLGMLLIFNDHAKAADKHVTLRNSQGEVREILSVARMERIFEIV